MFIICLPHPPPLPPPSPLGLCNSLVYCNQGMLDIALHSCKKYNSRMRRGGSVGGGGREQNKKPNGKHI